MTSLKLFIFTFLILVSQKSVSQDAQIKAVDINALVNMLEGSFSSEEQSNNDSDYFDIRLHMKKIWTDRADGKWLYAEQSVAQYPDNPYRQRVYKITQTGSNSFESEVFTLNDPLRFTGEWQKENPLSDLIPDSLTSREGCTVYLTLINDTTFQGSTKDNNCPSERSGAKYATSEVIITKDGITSWDRGFDESGKQVWGAVKGGYIFRRID